MGETKSEVSSPSSMSSVHLVLVRHGEAQHLLTRRGEKQIETLAGALLRRRLNAVLIRHSDLPRTKQSAEILSRLLGIPAGEDIGLRAEASPDDLALEMDLAEEDTILVSHQPLIEALLTLLIDEDGLERVDAVGTADAVILRRNGAGWSLVDVLRGA